MKIAIHQDGKYGFVQYNAPNGQLMVTHPDGRVRQRARDYLNKDRGFTVVGNHNSREIVYSKAVASHQFMDMALCEMFYNTGVHVDWNHADNDFEGANKPILKSMDGDVDYEIINCQVLS